MAFEGGPVCPMFKEHCASGCAWMIRARRSVEGVMVEENVCVVVALARELVRVNDARSRTAKV